MSAPGLQISFIESFSVGQHVMKTEQVYYHVAIYAGLLGSETNSWIREKQNRWA